jgi:ribulose-5-phosphate 4-epimerase/fuculose-1-phosphate aldolase
MTVVRIHQVPSLRQRVSDEEWQARLDLAAAYRLVAHYGWTHLINNHISLRVPGTEDQFLINPYGLLYEQVTASNLVKIDVDGNILDETPYQVNRAGFVIHSAIHMARQDLHAVLHTHTVAGQALSALDCGLLPLNQSAMRFYKRIGYHDFDVGEAFNLTYYLEKSCETQMMVLASNQPYSLPSEASCEKSAEIFWGNGRVHDRDWPALMQLVESIDPSFRN